MSSRQRRKVLTSLEVCPGSAPEAFNFLSQSAQAARALDLAEWWLRTHHDDADMLFLYAERASRDGKSARAAAYLEAGLESSALHVDWDRAYQYLRADRTTQRQLAARYDGMLSSHPDSAELLYLRARVEEDGKLARSFLERARRADPSSKYPLLSLAYREVSAGNWTSAKELLLQVMRIAPQDLTAIHALAAARLALGELEELERDFQSRVSSEPLHPHWNHWLCEALIARGKRAEAHRVLESFERGGSGDGSEYGKESIRDLRRHVLYAEGDFAALEKFSRADGSIQGRKALAWALIEAGRLKDALKAWPPEEPAREEPFELLGVAVALREGGEVGEAERWLQRACEKLEGGEWDQARAAALLKRAEPPLPAELDAVVLVPEQKAVLLAALAQRHPDRSAALLTSANSLNVRRTFPYHLIERAAARFKS